MFAESRKMGYFISQVVNVIFFLENSSNLIQEYVYSEDRDVWKPLTPANNAATRRQDINPNKCIK